MEVEALTIDDDGYFSLKLSGKLSDEKGILFLKTVLDLKKTESQDILAGYTKNVAFVGCG